MKRVVLGILVAGLVAGPAAADSYRYVTKTPDGSAIFLDEDSVVRTDHSVAYWIVNLDGRYLHNRPAKFAYYLMREVIDCSTQMLRPTGMSVYGPTGALLTADNKGGEVSSIEPGTIEQDLYNDVCRKPADTDALLNSASPLSLAHDFRQLVLSHTK